MIVPAAVIPGLYYKPSYLSETEQAELATHINTSSWSHDLRRRTQQYGYKYNYNQKTVHAAVEVPPMPSWLSVLAARIARDCNLQTEFNSAIINEYRANQLIHSHIDNVVSFGDTIATISLYEEREMIFRRWYHSLSPARLLLQAGSLLLLQDQARYSYSHAIPVGAATRISVTFRTALTT